MINSRQLFLLLLCVTAGLALVSCQAQDSERSNPAFDRHRLFGDGIPENSPVICRVGDLAITERDLELRLDEMRESEQVRYDNPDGRRLLLKKMVDETLLVHAGYEHELYNDAEVTRKLIANRRILMTDAMLHIGLLKDREPSLDEIREYYLAHREQYINQGIMQARHIACATEDDADRAYERLIHGEGRQALFPYVAGDLSINEKTRRTGGDLGWFNKGGFIPMIPESKVFIAAIWDFDIGLHPPIEVNGRWHVVEVLRRDYARPMTLDEAEFRVKQEMMPLFQDEIIKAFLAEQSGTVGITYFGNYRPGEGKSDRELFERAFHAQDPSRKQALYELLIEDYPESELVDDSLFMLGDLAREGLQDIRLADNYVRRVLKEFPDSEYADDTRYILDNLHNPRLRTPTGGEELQR